MSTTTSSSSSSSSTTATMPASTAAPATTATTTTASDPTDPAATQKKQQCDAQYLDKIKAANQALFELSELNDCDAGTAAAAEYKVMNSEIASNDAAFYDVISRLNQAVKNYDAAVKLDKDGEYMSSVIERNIQANEQYIGDKNSGLMTAQRLVSINRQELIYYMVVCQYLRMLLVFLSLSIVLMFITQQRLIPYVYYELILGVVGFVFAIVLVVRICQNLNHYRMLYQERVFYYGEDLETTDNEGRCEACPTCDNNDAPKESTSCQTQFLV